VRRRKQEEPNALAWTVAILGLGSLGIWLVKDRNQELSRWVPEQEKRAADAARRAALRAEELAKEGLRKIETEAKRFKLGPLLPYLAPITSPAVQRRVFAMWDSVKNAFWNFTVNLEGATAGHVGVPFMYQDTKNLITTGIGNLLDTSGKPSPTVTPAALRLPWLKADGSRASPNEIAAEWTRIRARPDLAPLGGGRYASVATLHLDDAAIQNLAYGTLKDFEATLMRFFPAYASWPADAQLGLLSMSWGLGPNFAPGYPKFTAAANASPPNFAIAAEESSMKNARRDAVNAVLFSNAAQVVAQNSDPSVLHFPTNLSGPMA
jgi:hypothetical protein